MALAIQITLSIRVALAYDFKMMRTFVIMVALKDLCGSHDTDIFFCSTESQQI